MTIATSSGNNCISGYDEMFKAIGSTSSVDARNHTNSSGLGVPIYWLNGSKVADNYNDFFDGSWSNVNPGKNPSGNDVAFAIDSRVWTGSTSGGVEYLANGVSHALGATSVRAGSPGFATPAPLSSANYDGSQAFPLYGLSPVFRVSSSVSITLSSSSLEVSEGGSASFTVVLDSEPTGSVTIWIGLPTGTDLTLNKGILTFTTGDWNIPQTVEVTAGQDHDEVDDTATLTLSASCNYGSGSSDLAVNTSDDDSPAVTLLLSDTSIGESGGTSTVTAMLDRASSADTTVTVSVAPVSPAVAGDITLSENRELTITAGTTRSTGTVTVTAVDNDMDAPNTVVKVKGSAANNRGIMDPADVELTIEDDDTRGVTVSESSLVIDEGTSETYTVVLDSQPTASVTVTVTVPAGTDVSVNNPSLTFTASDWSQAQTIEVNAADDDDALADATVILTHTVRGGDYIGASAADVEVTIVENDTPTLSVLDVRAGEDVGEMVFAVTLSLASSHEVTVDYATSNGTAGAGSDYTAGAGTLTFAAGTTTAQAIRVPIVDDTVDEEEEETFAVTLRNPANAHLAGAAATLAVTGTITDNDDPAVTVAFAAGAYTATEGGTAATVTVRLSKDPERAVTIPIIDTPGGGVLATDYSGVPGSVAFAAGDTQKTFTVTAVDDAVDEDDERVTLGFGALPAGVMAGSPSTAVLTLADDDTRGVTLSETTLSVAEEDAAGAGYTVVLDSQPTGDVTVTVSGMAGTALTADPASLTFTSGDWSSAQTVTVSAAADANAVDETLVLSHTAAGGGYDDVPHETLSVTVDDDEAVSTAVTLSVVPAVVAEGAGTTSVTVTATLNGGTRDTPTVVAVVVGSKTATSGADFDAVGAFDVRIAADTPSGMETFTLMPVNDAVDESDETVEVSGSATGLATDLAVVGTELTITDDDTRGVTVSESSLVIDEGTSETYTVVLDSQPTANVTVEVTVPAGTDVSVNNPSLTFTASDWSQAQTIEVSAAADDDALADAAVILTHTVRGGDYIGASAAGVEVTIVENDTPTLSVLDVRAGEDVGEMVFAVTLSLASSNEVTVDYATSDGTAGAGSDYTAGAGTLTFAAGTTTAQAIRVPIVDDTVDEEEEETFAVTLRNAANAHLAGAAATLAVTGTITDNDDPAVTVAFAAGAYTATEGGTAATVTVRLSKDPERAVTIPIIDTPGGGVLATDYSGVPGSVAFAAGDTQKTFTVTAVDDAVDEDDERVTLGFGALPAGVMAGSPSTAVLTLADDDTRGVTLSETTLSVAEEDAAGAGYTVVLDSQPTGDVTVTVSGMAGTALTADPASVTFTSGDWSSAQTVTVSAAADANAVDETLVLSHTAAGGGYDDVPHETLSVTVDDDEAVSTAVTLSVVPAVVAEGAGTTSVTVTATLNGGTRDTPTVVAVVVGSKTATSGADFDAVGAFDVRIAADTPSGMETFTLMPVNDAVDESDETVEVSGSATGLATDLAVVGTELTITDDDTRGVTVSESSLVIDEGTSETYTVVLDSQPTANVTVEVTVPAGTDVSVNQPSLTFTASDWSQAQTIEVSAADDDDALADATVILTHTVRGGDYIGASAAGVEVTIVENDTPTLSVLDVRAGEDVGEMVFAVTLSLASSNEVTVDYATSDGTAGAGSDYTAGAGTLTFAAGTTTAQAIRVPIVDDTVDEEEEETFAVTLRNPANAHLAGAAATLTATGTITDNDDPAVTVAFAAGAYTATEGGTAATVTVRLSKDPERAVTIPIIDTPGSGVLATDYSGVPGSVTFAAGDTQKTFTVTAVDDAVDEDDERVTLGFGALPAGVMAGSPSTAVLTLADDDTAGVTVSESSLVIDEGTSKTYTMVLDSQPTASVTVAVTVPAGTDVSVNQPSLTFTALDWSQAQTIEVNAADDDDALADATVILTHTVSGGDYIGASAADVEVTIVEDDTPALSVSDVRAGEDVGEMVFAVTLSLASSNEVTVDYATSNGTAGAGSDYTAATGTLTFAAGTTTAQAIRVPIVDDTVDEEEEETFAVTLRNPANAHLAGAAATLAVTGTITDNDDPAVTVAFAAGAYTATEGGTAATVTVRLSTDPERAVTIPITDTPGGGVLATDYSGVPGSVAFAAGDTQKTFTVTAVDDAVDEDDERVTLGFGALPAGVMAGSPSTAVLTLADDDTRGVTLSETTLSVAEEDAAGAGYTVVLDSQPTGDVTVTVSGMAGTALTADPASLTFTSGDWSSAQTVTVSAAADANAVDETLVLSHTAAGGGYDDVPHETLSVTVDDDEAVSTAVTLSVVPAVVAEGAGTTSVTVTATLNGGTRDTPTVVAVVVGSKTATSGADFDAVGAFDVRIAADTPSGMETFTLMPVNDAVDESDETVEVSGSATGLATDLAVVGTELTITDDDTRGVTLSETTLVIDEGTSETYTVVLTSQPTASVTVEVTVPAGTDVSVNNPSLTFTASDWNQAQAIEVSAADDDDALADATVILTHTVRGGDYIGASAADVEVTIVEDDTPTLSVSDVRAGEAVGEMAFAVTLSLASSNEVTVDYATSNGTAGAGSDYTAATGTLTFAAGTTTAQAIRVPIVDDTVDEEEEETFAVTLRNAANAHLAGAAATLTVTGTITDNDDPAVTVAFAAGAYTATERGTAATVTVRLSKDPERTVAIPITDTPGSGVLATDYSGVPGSVAFAAGDTQKTFTVTAADDAVDEDDESVTLGFGALPAGVMAGSPSTAVLTLADNDTRGVTLSETTLVIDEGTSGTYTVVLDSEPAGGVTVTPSLSSGDKAVTVSGALSFTADNWSTAQTVTVSAEQDPDSVDDAVVIGHAVAGGDYGANDVEAPDVSVTVDDDEPVLAAFTTVTLSVVPAVMAEDAGTTSVTVTARLHGGTRDTATVVVAVVAVTAGSKTATSETDFAPVGTFDVRIAADTLSGTGTFMLTPVNDAVDEADETVEVSGSATGLATDLATDLAVVGTELTIIDDDTRGVTVSESSLVIDEGTSETYTVVLDSQPTASVTVTSPCRRGPMYR